jgi:sialate O-acetylesterase
MVLQQKMKVAVWGWAEPGEKVKVKAGWQWFASSTKADDEGKWMIKVKTPGAGGPYEITIKAENTIVLENVLVGEVWVCSGQSNMEMPVGNVASWYSGVLNYEEEIAAADYPQIRLFKVARKVADDPQADCGGLWSPCNPKAIVNFAAAAYFFGRELHKELDVPIGLIDASNGGTNISAWMSKKVLESDADYKPILDNFQRRLRNYPQAMKEYQRKLAEHQKLVAKAKAEGKPVPWRQTFSRPVGQGHRNTPAGLYNGMIAPLVQYSIAGVIWYQGENNTSRSRQYHKLFPALIENWRNGWGQGDFPFYFVQLASFDTSVPWWGGAGINWVLLREAQLMTMSVPNTGMAVAIDIGDANDTHAKNKQDVGKRLALWALGKTYGKNLVYSGPIYKSMEIKGNKIVLHFEHTGSGLVARGGGELKGFVISGAAYKFVKADAVVDGDIVVVSSREITEPVAVRYGWKDYPVCNLYNREGLPASPFRTDDWIGIEVSRK